MLGAPFDELGEQHDCLFKDLLVDLAGVAPLGDIDEGAVAIPDAFLMFFGDAQQISDGPHRHHRPEVGDEIESPRTDERVEFAGAEFTHQGFDGQHASRREDTRQQPAVQVVQRRILEQQNARRHLDVVEQNVGGGPAAGSIGFPVVQFARDVVVAAQRIEVVLFVVIQRRFFTHPFPHRVRVVVDIGIIRVVI